MEIKRNSFSKRKVIISFIKRKLYKKWLLILLITGIPTVIIISPVVYRLAYKNYDKLPLSKAFIGRVKDTLPFQMVQSNFKENVPFNIFKGILQKSEPLVIDINFKNYKKLQDKRNKAIKREVLYRENDDYVSAKIKYKDKDYKAKIRLKGDWIDHLAGKRWSFRVKILDGKSLFGMRKFSLQTPKTRNYINEWIFHKLMKYENLPSLRYKFVPLILNGNNYGIYALEEHFDKILIESNKFKEGPIIRLDDNILWKSFKRIIPENISSGYYKSYPKPFKENQVLKNKVLENQLIKANQLLTGYKYKKLKASDVFDIDSLAKYLAIADLNNAKHGIVWENLPFYYNPITSKLMIIGFDAYPKKELLDKLAIEEPRMYNFFRDQNLLEKYVYYLEKYSSENYLKTFLKEIEKPYKENMNILYKSYPALVSNLENIFKNQEIINEKLNPIMPLNVYFKSVSSDNKLLTITTGNNQILPIKINGIFYKNKLIFEPKNQILVSGTRRNNFVNFSNHELIPVENLQSFDILKNKSNKLYIDYKITGTNTTKRILFKNYKRENPINALSDYVRTPSNYRDFEFIKHDKENKILYFKNGEWEIEKSLILPPNYKVVINPGTTLKLTNKAGILSFSKLNFKGTKLQPIKIIGSSNRGNFFVVINAKDISTLENVLFSNLSSSDMDYWSISGAVTFYESPAVFKNCIFKNNNSEDSLNLIRSKFRIINSLFSDAKSDALDIDFSDGSIENLQIINSGNDALDISGSEVSLNSLYILKAEDKGISLGESSSLKGKNIFISGAEIAIASKDLSNFNAKDIYIESSTIAYVVFQKKPEYGPSKLNLLNVKTDNISNDYLMEEGSSLMINGKNRQPNATNVEKVLYGNLYGKKSG